MRKRELQRRQVTAYHEAGHAVAHQWLFGRPVRYVTIIPDEDTQGRVRIPFVLPKGFPDRVAYDAPEFQPRHQRLLERAIMEAMAGEAATFLLRRRRDHVGAGNRGPWMTGDTRDIWRLIGRACDPGDNARTWGNQEAHAYAEWLWLRTLNLLRRRPLWWKVTAIAEALQERGTLRRADIETLWRKA